MLASFERWRNGTGGAFELLTRDAEWAIVGSSPVSRTYHSRQAFLDAVIHPLNARMAKPLVPTVRGIYAGGDIVIILFDGEGTASDGVPYRNEHVVNAIAFFDTREFDDVWARVSPTP